MEKSRRSLETLLLILVPMLLTFVTQRLILHHSSPETHVYVAGILVHHLFSGVALLVPTAFLLAFGIQSPGRRKLALVMLGFSSAMVLDEVVYLVCTDGSGVAYRGRVSFWGAFALLTGATIFLIAVQQCTERRSRSVDPEPAISRSPTAE